MHMPQGTIKPYIGVSEGYTRRHEGNLCADRPRAPHVPLRDVLSKPCTSSSISRTQDCLNHVSLPVSSALSTTDLLSLLLEPPTGRSPHNNLDPNQL